MYHVGVAGKGMEMGIYFGGVPFSPLVFCGTAGCLVSALLVGGILGQLLLVISPAVSWSVVWVPILWMLQLFGLLLITGTLMTLLGKYLILLMLDRRKQRGFFF